MEELVIQAKAGCGKSQEEIILRLRPLVISSINRYYPREEIYEDLIQEGNLKIWQCILDYDINMKIYFLGYVKMKLRFFYLDMNKVKGVDSFSLEEKDENGLGPLDKIPDGDQGPLLGLIKKEEGALVLKLLDRLSPRERELIYYYYFLEIPLKDLGPRMGITYRTLINTKSRAVRKLREAYKDTFDNF